MKNIGIIGAGNLGSSIAFGLLKSGKYNVHTFDPVSNNLKSLQEKGALVHKTNKSLLADSDLLILAIKPFKVSEVLSEIKTFIKPKQAIISVVSGVLITDIQKGLSTPNSIFRFMPNTAVSVQESTSCFCGENYSKEQKEEVINIFSELGEVIEINETLMDAATVLGACGIAYVMRFIRAMVQGGIEIGFDSETAKKIATQTVKGATELLIQNLTHPEAEIDKVTTPKGCTIVGLNEMEHQGFSSSLIKGVKTSFNSI